MTTTTHQPRLFQLDAPPTSHHGWIVVCEEVRGGVLGYCLRWAKATGNQAPAWLSRAELREVIAAWDMKTKTETAPEEL